MFIQNTVLINASAEKVWDALTNPEQTKKYMFGCEAISEWTVGSPIVWKGLFDGKEIIAVKGYIQAFEKFKLLGYSVFDPHASYADILENYTTVTCRLTKAGEQIRLEINQGDFSKVAEGQKRYDESMAGGGWRSILDQIKVICEN
jgi:uncharacterized protein YndB with AHSA1/START domain